MSGNGNNPLAGVSQDVAAILGQAQEREDERGLPKWKREQAKRDRKRVKLTVDLTDHPWLEAEVRRIADVESAGISSVVAHLMALGLREYGSPKKVASRSRQHSFDLVVEK